MHSSLHSSAPADFTDLIRVAVYLLDNGSHEPDRPGTTFASDLVLARPRSGARAVGTLEILHRIDGLPECPEGESVEISLAFDPPQGTEPRLIIDSSPEDLGTALMVWFRGTADDPSSAGKVRAAVPNRDPSRLVPLAFDVHSLRRAIIDGHDLDLPVNVMTLAPGCPVPIELSIDDHGNGWDEQGRFRFISAREL